MILLILDGFWLWKEFDSKEEIKTNNNLGRQQHIKKKKIMKKIKNNMNKISLPSIQ